MSGEPVLYAYNCSTNDPEESRILFAASHDEARRRYASEMGYSDGTTIRRAPQHDVHAPGPVPPLGLIDDGWYMECTFCRREIRLSDAGYEKETPERLREAAARNAEVRRDLAAFDIANPKPEQPIPGCPPQEHWRAEQAVNEWHRRRGSISWRMIDRPLSRPAMVEDGGDLFCDHRCHLDHIDRVADIDLAHADAEREAERRWPGAPSYTSRRYPYLEPSVTFRPPGFEADVSWNVEKDEKWVYPEDLERWNLFVQGLETKDGTNEAGA